MSIVRRKSLSTSQHGHNSSISRDSTFVELHDVAVTGGKERSSSVDSGRGERGGVMTMPSPVRGSVVGTVSENWLAGASGQRSKKMLRIETIYRVLMASVVVLSRF